MNVSNVLRIMRMEVEDDAQKPPRGQLMNHQKLGDRGSNLVSRLASKFLKTACTWDLFLSTLTSFFLTRWIYNPTPLTFIIAWPASELVHFLSFFQALNLYLIHWACPSIFDGYFSKALLAVNLFSFFKQSQAFNVLLASKHNFNIALLKSGILPRSGRSKVLFLASLLPLTIIGRRGRRIQKVSMPYLPIDHFDPELVQEWHSMSKKLRNLQLYVGRDGVQHWMSLDVITTDPLPPHGSPVLIYIHGGGWCVGSKFFAGNGTLSRVASRGIIVVTINYRLAPERTFPTQILDCKRALIYVKRNCHRWNGDPRLVFVSGESAGGHLAALMGVTSNVPLFQPPEDASADTSIAGCIPLYGVMDWTDSSGNLNKLHPPLVDGLQGGMMPFFERVVMQKSYLNHKHDYELASPTHHVKRILDSLESSSSSSFGREGPSSDPICPFMVVHGTRDALAPLGDSKEFFETLQMVRIKAHQPHDTFMPVRGGHHGFGYFVSPFAMALGDAVTDFVFHHVSARNASEQSEYVD